MPSGSQYCLLPCGNQVALLFTVVKVLPTILRYGHKLTSLVQMAHINSPGNDASTCMGQNSTSVTKVVTCCMCNKQHMVENGSSLCNMCIYFQVSFIYKKCKCWPTDSIQLNPAAKILCES